MSINAVIYIVNLDRAKERRDSVEKELRKTNLPFQFISAVDKTTVANYKYKIRNQYKRPLITTEIACYLSHLKVKKLFLKSNYDYAIILEDDVELLANFDTVVKTIITQYNTLPKKHQWDVLKLPSFGKKNLIKVYDIDSYHSLYGGSVAITTMAAIWTKTGVKKFLGKAVLKDEAIINMPIDCELQRAWKYNLKIYNIAPPIVRGKEFGSQIRPKTKLRSKLINRVNYETRKLLPKFYLYLTTLFNR
ncbi:glycosyltransferase family 25 protein [Salegentibacter sp. HM20]